MMARSHSPVRATALAAARSSQQGAATLVVVMILFFIMAMMAAYANRNLIFEQRISSNYYRTGVAVEAADAGAEWALAMLNAGNVDDSCASPPSATSTFRDRYFSLNADTRVVTPNAVSSVTAPTAACFRLASGGGPGGWNCSCPSTPPWTPPATPVVAATQMQPSFQVSFSTSGPGVLSITSVGCTGSDPTPCVIGNETAAAAQMVGSSYVSVKAALLSALKTPPSAPLTVLSTVTDGLAGLGLHNTDPQGNGLLLVAGGDVPAGTLSAGRLDSLPGTPAQGTLLANNSALGSLSIMAGNNTYFAHFFGMAPEQYGNQPAIRRVDCSAGCSDTNLANMIATGARMVWLSGAVTLSSTGTFGSATSPVAIFVDGDLTLSGSLTVNGLLYATGNINADAPQIRVNGAVISQRNLNVIGGGHLDITYQAAIINTLNNGMGSFIRVPGSWWEGGLPP